MKKIFNVKMRVIVDLDENVLSVAPEMHETDLEEVVRDALYGVDGLETKGVRVDEIL